MDMPPLGAFIDYLGLRFAEVTGDRVEATWTAGPHLHQTFGIVHGGVHASIVETLGSLGATAWYEGRGRCVGVTNTTDFFRPITDGELTSAGLPIQQDDDWQVWQVETRDLRGRLVSNGRVRLRNLPG